MPNADGERYLTRANTLAMRYPPRSDVASRCQIVPCTQCGQDIFIAQDHASLLHSTMHRDGWGYHTAMAESYIWRKAGYGQVRIWLPFWWQ